MAREFACGVLALALALAYLAMATDIPLSLLSDEVGADGVPKALAVVLAILGVAQVVRALVRRRAAGPDEMALSGWHTHLRAAGVIGLGIVYMIATPYLGYPLAVAALIFAMTIYAGMRVSPRLAGISVVGGLALWFMFVKALGIAMPVGVFARALG
jgi:putative tricarboxylic transport membrane protein